MHVEFINFLPENFFQANHSSSVKRPTKGRQISLSELVTVLLVYVIHPWFPPVFFRTTPHLPQSSKAPRTYKVFVGLGTCFGIF